MFVICLGPPTAMSRAGLRLLEIMLYATRGDYTSFSATTVEEFKSIWDNIRTSSRLIFSDCPNAELCSLLDKSSIPIIVLLEDPVRVIEEIISVREEKWQVAMATASLSLSSIEGILTSDNAYCLKQDCLDRPVKDMLCYFASLHGIKWSADQTLKASAALALDDSALECMTFRQFRDSIGNSSLIELSPSAKSIIHEALPAPSQQSPRAARRLSPILFQRGDRPGSYVEEMLDLTGRPKVIVYGPYFHLPRGLWTAAVFFSLKDNNFGLVLKFEVFNGHSVVEALRSSDEDGSFQCSLQFQIMDNRDPVEIRVSSYRGIIEGYFLLTCVSLYPS